jgi:hypothetical protein
MRFILGLLFGMLLGGVGAALLAAQRPAEPDDQTIFGLDEPVPPAPALAT